MKIKDLIESIGSMKNKIYIASRIFNCSSEIKEAIKTWKNDEYFPVVKILVEAENEAELVISSYDLVNLYGYDELTALLMLDDIKKAQEKHDKERLNRILTFLVSGKHITKTTDITKLMKNVEMNNPEVWDEYQKLCKDAAMKDKELEDNYTQIIETEL